MERSQQQRTQATWFKSSHSGTNGGDCVEVAMPPGTVQVRDSKDPHGPRLTFTPQGWAAFVEFARQV